MKVVQVSQFFDYKSMTWNQLIAGKEKGVLPSTTGDTFLWSETPKLKVVKEEDHPQIGDVWLIKDKGNTIKVYKTNYDSSD